MSDSFIGRRVYHQHILDKILINSTKNPERYDFEINSVYMEFYFVAQDDLLITFRLNATGAATLYINTIDEEIIKMEGCEMKSKNITVIMFNGYTFMKLDYAGMTLGESYISLEYSIGDSNEFKIVSNKETVIYGRRPGFMVYEKIEVASNAYVCNFPHLINGFATHYSISPTTLPDGLEFNNETGRIMGKTLREMKEVIYYTVTAYSQYGKANTSFYISVVDRIHQGVFKVIRTLTGHKTELNMYHSNNNYFIGYDYFTGCKLHDLYPNALDNSIQISSVTMALIPKDADIYRICIKGSYIQVRIEINCTTYTFDYDGYCQDINLFNDCFYQTTIIELFSNIKDHDSVNIFFIGRNGTLINPFYYSSRYNFYYEITYVKLYKGSHMDLYPIYNSSEIDIPDYYYATNPFPPGINISTNTGRISGVTADDSDSMYQQQIVASYQNNWILNHIYVIYFQGEKMSPVFQIHYLNSNAELITNVKFMQYSNVSEVLKPYIFGYVTYCIITPPLPPGLFLNSHCYILGIPTQLQSNILYNVTAYNVEGGKTTSLSISIERCKYVTAVNISIDNFEVLYESDIEIYIRNNYPLISDVITYENPYKVYCIEDGMFHFTFDILNYQENYTDLINTTMRFTNGGLIKKFTLTQQKTTIDVIILNPPMELHYNPSDIELQVGLLPKAIPAHFINTANFFSCKPGLPPEIYINAKGEIVGVPLKVMNKNDYRITACNENNCTSTNITITITPYGCYPIESYPAVKLGYVAYINCGYNYYGNKSRVCHSDSDLTPTWAAEIIKCYDSPTQPTKEYILVTYKIKIDISPSYFTLYHQHNLNYKIRNVSKIELFYFTYKTVRPSMGRDYGTEIIFQFCTQPQYKSSVIQSTSSYITSEDFWIDVFDEEHTFTILSADINEYKVEKDYSIIVIIASSVIGFIVIVIGIVLFCKKTHRLHNVNPKFDIEYYLPFVNSGNVAISPKRGAHSYTDMNIVNSTNSSPSRSHLKYTMTSKSLESEESDTLVQI